MLRDDSFFERCVQECMRENIQHHIEILKFFSLYQDLSSTIFGVIIGVSMMILASLSLVLTKTELLSFETLKFAFFFFVELLVVFGYCLMGTFLTDSSLEIPSALYNCHWYYLNEKHRRMLRIFQINSSISIELRGNGLFLIDLQLFVQIVQTTYSIFNIFTSMES
ncbi:odorant receptor coreceptor-like [Nilaparvata lugens]|uniref:odorant receptor coreceptor-like n=1 Tax=Nilaparvata lugens TaxID=108931 RepID=UPI00193DB253|nr:odorant receptor coreceptor-like [Nilaparvata lugens]